MPHYILTAWKAYSLVGWVSNTFSRLFQFKASFQQGLVFARLIQPLWRGFETVHWERGWYTASLNKMHTYTIPRVSVTRAKILKSQLCVCVWKVVFNLTFCPFALFLIVTEVVVVWEDLILFSGKIYSYKKDF